MVNGQCLIVNYQLKKHEEKYCFGCIDVGGIGSGFRSVESVSDSGNQS